MQTNGDMRMDGAVALKVIRGRPHSRLLTRIFTGTKRESEVTQTLSKLRDVFNRVPVDDLPDEIAELEHRLGMPSLLEKIRPADRARVLRSYFKVLTGRLLAPIADVTVLDSCLSLRVLRGGRIQDMGIVSMRVVTTTGVGFIVDAFQNLVELELMHFHGIGTGTGSEAVGDTALGTELTTEYNPNSTRATGTQTESAATVYVTVGTNTLDSGTPAITEHGIFSQAATGGGVLLDRSVFAAINLVGANGDGLQSSYSLTVSAGG